MHFDFDNNEKPLFIQVAEQIKEGIIKKVYVEGEQVPSSTEIFMTYKLNPATVNKGVNLLVEEGIIYKKRGIGMFVAQGAEKRLINDRKKAFYDSFILPMLEESKNLSIPAEDIIELIKKDSERGEEK